MAELLRDPIWQFAGFVATIITAIWGVMIAYHLYKKQVHGKKLVYAMTNNSIITSRTVGSDGLEIMYKGQRILDPHLISLKIFNDGDLPIQAADYEAPIELFFGNKSKILSADIKSCQPEELMAHISIMVQAERVTLNRFLMNQGDSITINVLVDQPEKPTLTARIIGVKNAELVDHRYWERKAENKILIFRLAVLFVSSIFIVVFFPNVARLALDPFVRSATFIYGFAFGVIVVSLIGWIYLLEREWSHSFRRLASVFPLIDRNDKG